MLVVTELTVLWHRAAAQGRGRADARACQNVGTVEPPPWIENRLMSHVPLVAFTHDERFELERPWVDFEPKCSAGIYTMLETFSGEDPVRDRYGAICDGARGSFNH